MTENHIRKNSGEVLQAALVPRDELKERISGLSADKFLAVYRLYERLGQRVSVDNEMTILRQRLKRIRPRRAPSFTRLLCLPFEEFITDGGKAGAFCIPRSQCKPFARLVAALVGPEETRALRSQINTLEADDTDAMKRIGATLWRRAVVALDAARIEERRKRPETSLRNSLNLMLECLRVGPQLAELSLGLPRERFRHLDQRAKGMLANVLTSVPKAREPLLIYPLVLLSLRLETPPAVIPVLQDNHVPIPDKTRAAMLDMMSRHLERDLQAEVGFVQELAKGLEGPGSLDLIDRFLPSILKARANLNCGIGEIPARMVLETCRDAFSRLLVAPVQGTIRQHLEELHQGMGGDGRPATWDIGERLARLQPLARIEDQLQTLATLEKYADILGMRQELGRATDQAGDIIHEAVDAHMERLDDAADMPSRERSRETVFGLLRLVEILDGPERAEDLRLECIRRFRQAAA